MQACVIVKKMRQVTRFKLCCIYAYNSYLKNKNYKKIEFYLSKPKKVY